MEARILSRKLIKPSSPTPAQLRAYKLSFFDQLAPQAHVPFIFFYSATKDINVHKQLELSLSQTLTRFYPLAGRYVKDELLIDCNDQGVAYLEAQVNCELTEFLDDWLLQTELVDRFVPRDIGAATLVTSPIMGIQVTVFKCGGIALTVHNSHIIADAFTFSSFMHEWAITNRLGDSSEVLKWPSFDLAALFPARDLSRVRHNLFPQNSGSAKIVTRTFLFDGKTMSDLKAKCMLEGGVSGSDSTSEVLRQTSKVEVVLALIWRVLINVARAKHGQLRDSTMSISIGLRGIKTGVTTPECTLGNFYMVVPVKFKSDTNKMELHDLVGLIATTRKIRADFANITNGDDIFSNVVDFINEIGEGMHDEKVDVRSFTSLSKLPFYETDFGWGKPCWTRGIADSTFELVALLDTKCGTGIEAWVNLNEMDMLKFECDPDILTFTS